MLAEQKAGGYSTKYRFTGKEVDEETGLYYFGARYYDPRISLWYGVDPMTEKYPAYNPFNYTINNPIIYTDPDGRDVIIAGEGDEKFIWNPGAEYKGNNEFIKTTVKSLNELTSDPKLATMKTKNAEGNVILSFVGKKSPNVEIYQSDGGSTTSETGSQIGWNPNEEIIVGKDKSGENIPGKLSATTILGHEFGHAFLAAFDKETNSIVEGLDAKDIGKLGPEPSEHGIILPLERRIAKSRNEGQRFVNRFLSNEKDVKKSGGYGDYRRVVH
ncbi:MAG: hypothetical protein IPJ83_06840 [Saprospiraceae bacterium]|nr:hypothetical protein [Candidatus Vicinibacter proximus]